MSYYCSSSALPSWGYPSSSVSQEHDRLIQALKLGDEGGINPLSRYQVNRRWERLISLLLLPLVTTQSCRWELELVQSNGHLLTLGWGPCWFHHVQAELQLLSLPSCSVTVLRNIIYQWGWVLRASESEPPTASELALFHERDGQRQKSCNQWPKSMHKSDCTTFWAICLHLIPKVFCILWISGFSW